MNHASCKTFIAFVNIDKKDKFFVDGNDVWDKVSPKIYPYESKEDKDNAKGIGYRIANWDQSGDLVEGIILKVHETVPIISKKEAEKIEERFRQEQIEARRKIKEEDSTKPKKEKTQEPIPEIVPVKIEPTKKRGRPRIHNLVEE
jgi:tRNA G10  N-methylase Trm11